MAQTPAVPHFFIFILALQPLTYIRIINPVSQESRAKLELLELNYRHYDRGPIPDKDRPTDMVWEFIKELISIKLI
jgi:hypothetical protein